MNKLIFAILKVVEIALVLAFVYYIIYEPFASILMNKIATLIGVRLFIVVYLLILAILVFRAIKRGDFKAWISANKRWSKAIANSITKRKLKAYFVFLTTGWRSVEVFGHPKVMMGTYMVCLKNEAVMEFNYFNHEGSVRWWAFSGGDEYKEDPVMFWKPLPKAPKW